MGTKFQSERSEDAIIISTQFPANQYECNEPISKKQRIFEEFSSNPSYPKRAISLFFKTRLCVKFKSGSCSNGANCNFAHGSEDLRRPPPNWQDLVAKDGNFSEEQMLVKNRICKKFYRGEVCPYGERCTFMHVENFNAIKGSASSLESRDDDGGMGKNSESIVVVGSGNVYNQKVSFWKTRMCNKWEASGHCPFGDKCHFAHGDAELMEFRSHVEFDRVNAAAAPGKSHVQPVKDVTPSSTMSNVKHKSQGFLKWEGFQKLSHIYADWIDDLPLRGYSPPSKAGI